MLGHLWERDLGGAWEQPRQEVGMVAAVRGCHNGGEVGRA